MAKQRSTGRDCLVELFARTACGAGVWAVVASLWWPDEPGLPRWVLVVLGVVVIAVVAPIVLVVQWNARGGYAALRETYRWVCTGVVPAELPWWVWRARVTQVRQDVRTNGFVALCAAACTGFLVWTVTVGGGGGGPLRGTIVVWCGLVVVNAVRWFRWHGRTVRLLDGAGSQVDVSAWRDCPLPAAP